MTDVRPARGAGEVRAALALRHAVFVVEQRVPLADELDGRDETALHLVAIDPAGAVVGTCRLIADGATVKLGRMAVAAAARGQGIASRLLAEAEIQARALGARRIGLASQSAATALYERAGYRARGGMFLDAGIEHVLMEKRL
jgi:predicted GNAT family N-acyltransferase